MMLIRCLKCKEIFDSADLMEDRTEGGDIGEAHYSCPYCRYDDWEQVGQCSCCGRYFSYDELEQKIFGSSGSEMCEDCINDAITTDIGIEYGGDQYSTAYVELNGLYAYAFDSGEINDILHDYFKSLPEKEQKEKVMGYISCDMNEFADWYQK